MDNNHQISVYYVEKITVSKTNSVNLILKVENLSKKIDSVQLCWQEQNIMLYGSNHLIS
jgi:hypothetical protein